MVEYETLLVEKDEGVATVQINRPDALNALNTRVLEDLQSCFDELENDENVLVIVITGSGEKAFVAGADIGEMVDLDSSGGRDFGIRGHATLNRIERCPKPVIAAINGFALGGGCELAMACDIRYASERAKFGQPEVNLGIIPGFAGTQRLPRLVSKGKAKEMIFSGNIISAQEALEIGLVDRVFAPEQLQEEAGKLARTITTKGQLAVRATKELIDRGTDTDFGSACEMEIATFSKLFSSEDQKEGMKAFLEKRKAAFTGK